MATPAVTCREGIEREKSKNIRKEKGWTQRQFLEVIESLRRKNQGVRPLNTYNQSEQWQPVRFTLFEGQNLCMLSSDGMCNSSLRIFICFKNICNLNIEIYI